MNLKFFITYIAFAYKGRHDSDTDLAGLNRRSVDGSAPLRVEDDQGNCLDSPASVVGGQASQAPPVNELEQVARGTMGILQQLAQALQRAEQPAVIAPQ